MATIRPLTRAEEEVMQILWQLGRGVVHDILNQMPVPKPAYNTVSTMVRILESKGFVTHKAYGKTHEYVPIITREAYSHARISSVMEDYFEGSLANLVSFFAAREKLRATEIEELKKHIKKLK